MVNCATFKPKHAAQNEANEGNNCFIIFQNHQGTLNDICLHWYDIQGNSAGIIRIIL